MKHRSVIAFILLAAALFAAPQVSHDLSALKSALSARIRGEILHAFLNLRVSDGASELAKQSIGPQLASYQTRVKACAQQQASTKKSDSRAPQSAPRAEAAAQTLAGEQLAMLIAPSLGSEKSRAALSDVEAGVALGEVAGLPWHQLAQGDLAMLNPPDAGIELPAFADNRVSDSNERDGARRRQKMAETQRRVTYLATSFEQSAGPKAGEEMLRRLGSTLTDADVVRAAGSGLRIRVLKFRRASRTGGGSSKMSAPPPAKVSAPLPMPVAALIPPDLAQSPCAATDE